MTSINKFISRSAVALSLAAAVSSCSMEEPFGDGPEANLTISTEINGDVKKTRAEVTGDELAALREKCVVYIENNKGVIRKYKGLDNIPETVKLRTGEYVAEAWSGDSVSASFDFKFYRGWQKFEMNEGQNSLTLKCNIANVVVSVDPESLNVNLSDLKVTFSHSRGSLEFTESTVTDGKKGYFMMPNADKDLDYKVEGTKTDGSAFTKEGKIENVQRAHEYSMLITEDETPVTQGGALIRLEIADIELIETSHTIFAAPAVRGVGFDINEQVVNTERNFTDIQLYVRGYYGLSSILLSCENEGAGISGQMNLTDGSVRDQLRALGVSVEARSSVDAGAADDGQDVAVDEYYVTFSKAYLDALPASSTEYKFAIEAVDGNHKSGTGALRIANDLGAVEHIAPVSTADAPDPETQPMAIGARRAILTGYVNDSEAALNFGIKYRPQGVADWQVATPSGANAAAVRRQVRATRAVTPVPYTVTLSGLQPGTTYEFKAFCDEYDDAAVKLFTTESIFAIPNSSFEEWGTYDGKTAFGSVAKGIVIPGITGDKYTSFWGTGNEGGATAKMTMTDKSTDMVHSGTYSARLESKSALGVLAAGNLFVGEYDKASLGSSGAIGYINMGREYNSSHPSALKIYVNYRPGTVDAFKANDVFASDFVKDGLDHGQVYVALTDQIVNVITDPNGDSFFNPNDEHVLAYGEMTWKANFGSDGQLQEVVIPISYRERANTVKPKYLMITCCASKYGDYFSGSTTSVMYLDDVELVYE